jgi:transcriptional regulator with XRE-family HTH domain
MNPIRYIRSASGFSQQQLADAAGTSQPTIAAYENDRKSPTWRTVQRLADAAGCLLEVRCHPPLTREDRRSLALHAAIAEHLRAEPDAVLARARASVAHMHALHPGARPLLDEWTVLLRRPLSALLPLLSDPSPWARELRHVTPFAGVLSARERTAVYRAFAAAERESSHIRVMPPVERAS